MSSSCAALGLSSQTALESTANLPFSATSERYAITRSGESVQNQEEHQNPSTLDGFSAERSEDTVLTRKVVQGDLNMFASADNFERLFTRLLGGTKGDITHSPGTAAAADVWVPAPVLPDFSILADLDSAVFQWDGCKVARWSLRGQVNSFVELVVSVIGVSETKAAAGTFVAAALPSSPPYIFENGTLSLDIDGGGANNYRFRAFEFTYDNRLVPDYQGSTTPCEIRRDDKPTATLRIDAPFSDDNQALYPLPAAPAVSEVVLDMVIGNLSSKLTLPGCQSPQRTPPISGPGSIDLTHQFDCRTVGSAASFRAHVEVNNDNTP